MNHLECSRCSWQGAHVTALLEHWAEAHRDGRFTVTVRAKAVAA